MIAIKNIEEIPKYCWYWDTETRKWTECPIYKSCKHHTSHIEEKPSDCPLVGVTCKDCEHWDKELTPRVPDNKEYHYCPLIDFNTAEDCFCADAEKRSKI